MPYLWSKRGRVPAEGRAAGGCWRGLEVVVFAVGGFRCCGVLRAEGGEFPAAGRRVAASGRLSSEIRGKLFGKRQVSAGQRTSLPPGAGNSSGGGKSSWRRRADSPCLQTRGTQRPA